MARWALIAFLVMLSLTRTSDHVHGGYTSTTGPDGNCGLWEIRSTTGAATSPGMSGATLQVLDTTTIGWLLDTTNEYVYHTGCIPYGFDDTVGIVTLAVFVNVSLDGAESVGDTINMEMASSYFEEHGNVLTPKTQTRTVSHNIGSDNEAGDDHTILFVLNHRLADNFIDPGDRITIRYRLYSVAGGTDVAAVNFISSQIYARTCRMAPQTDGAILTEG